MTASSIFIIPNALFFFEKLTSSIKTKGISIVKRSSFFKKDTNCLTIKSNWIVLNNKFNYTDLFNQYVDVKYVKYILNPSSLDQDIKLIESGNFKVRLHSKNSAGHDSDKIGLLLL